MRPTEAGFPAQRLGMNLQFINWAAFDKTYEESALDMRADLAQLEIEVDIPDNAEAARNASESICSAIVAKLKANRSELGGDVYSLTLFYLRYLPLQLVVAAAFKLDTYEPLLRGFRAVLIDLGIESEFDELKKFIDLENAWLIEGANEAGIRVEDASKAAMRLSSRVDALWSAAEGSPTVSFFETPFHSVFISYSGVDETFSAKLYEALKSAGVRVWYAPHDMKAGRKLHEQIYTALEQSDKLLLVLSEASMSSSWVNTELYKTRERELRSKSRILFPIRLVPLEQLKQWQAFDADSGRDLAREVREYFIPDFSDWKDEEKFLDKITELREQLIIEESKSSSS